MWLLALMAGSLPVARPLAAWRAHASVVPADLVDARRPEVSRGARYATRPSSWLWRRTVALSARGLQSLT